MFDRKRGKKSKDPLAVSCPVIQGEVVRTRMLGPRGGAWGVYLCRRGSICGPVASQQERSRGCVRARAALDATGQGEVWRVVVGADPVGLTVKRNVRSGRGDSFDSFSVVKGGRGSGLEKVAHGLLSAGSDVILVGRWPTGSLRSSDGMEAIERQARVAGAESTAW